MQCFIYVFFLELLLLYYICSNFQIIKKKQKFKKKILLLCELFVTYKINNLFIFSLLLIKKTTDKFPRPCEVDLLFLASDRSELLVMQITALCPTFGVCTDALVLIARENWSSISLVGHI